MDEDKVTSKNHWFFKEKPSFTQNSMLDEHSVQLAIFPDGLWYLLNNKKHLLVSKDDLEMVKTYLKIIEESNIETILPS